MLPANNHIKHFGADQFDEYSSLEFIDLTSNVCIDGKFSGESEILEVLSNIKSNCKFERPKNKPDELNCDEILRCEFGLCCKIYPGAEILSPEIRLVSKDYPRVQSLTIRSEINSQASRDEFENIRYLPVANHFIRNLVDYRVHNTFLKTIRKENFEGMIWLEKLYLTSNLIEAIPSDSFQGLVRLKSINLGEKNINYAGSGNYAFKS